MKESVEVAGRHPDGIEHANVPQLASRTELVDGRCRNPQVRCDLPDRQQRPQPVRRILGERCKNLRIRGFPVRVIPSNCESLRSLATAWATLIRPSKPLAGGSSPSRRARKSMKCKREATLTNHGPFNDVRKLSATDKESLERWSHRFFVPHRASALVVPIVVTSRPLSGKRRRSHAQRSESDCRTDCGVSPLDMSGRAPHFELLHRRQRPD